MIEAEQTLFENGFRGEADRLLHIQGQLERVYDSLRNIPKPPQQVHLDISNWKNQTIRQLMVDIMRYDEESYRRYLNRESAMVQSELQKLRTAGTEVVPFLGGVVEQGAPPTECPTTLTNC